MTPEQVALVQSSFAQVLPIREQAATLFYGHLFDLDPTLRPLFKGDIAEQGRKLMSILQIAVNGLGRLDDILPAVRSLGQRHRDYGVVAAHYDTVAAALLWTLGQGLGEAFTPETEAAWTACYQLLAGAMIEAAGA